MLSTFPTVTWIVAFGKTYVRRKRRLHIMRAVMKFVPCVNLTERFPSSQVNYYMLPQVRKMVREKNSSRSGKCQGILFRVRENWHFEVKSGKIEIVRLI